MADLFLREDVLKLLEGKFILMIGDSNIRAFYKDLLHLYVKNDIAPPDFFRTMPNQDRTESCLGDHVLRAPKYVTQGRDNYEEREFKDGFVHIRFHFVTKTFGKTMQSTLRLIEDGIIPMPKIIVMNSCLWDLTRWGPKQEDNYKSDLISLFGNIKKIVSEYTLTIWCSTLPIAVQQCKGGIIIKQLEFMKHSLRFMVLEANKFTQQLCIAFGIDFLDLHYHMRFQLHRRGIDGIHWETHAIRMIICLVLTHIGLSFKIPLPGYMAEKEIDYVRDAYDKAAEVNFPPPLGAIEFHKDIQDKIERELEKCKEDENLKKRDMKERVFKYGRRRGSVTEGNGSSGRHQNSRSACVQGTAKNSEAMDYDAFNILKTWLKKEKSKGSNGSQNVNPSQSVIESSSRLNSTEISQLELYKMFKDKNLRCHAIIDSMSCQEENFCSNFPAMQSSSTEGQSSAPVNICLNSFATSSPSRFASLSMSRSASCRMSHRLSRSASHRTSCRISRSASRSISRSVSRSTSCSTSRRNSHGTSYRASRRISRSISRSVSRSTSRSTSCSTSHRKTHGPSYRASHRILRSISRSVSRSTSCSTSSRNSHETSYRASRRISCSISRSVSRSTSCSTSRSNSHGSSYRTSHRIFRSISRSISPSSSSIQNMHRSSFKTAPSKNSSLHLDHDDAAGLGYYLDHSGSRQICKEKISQNFCGTVSSQDSSLSFNGENVKMPDERNDLREWLTLQQLRSRTSKDKCDNETHTYNASDEGKSKSIPKLATSRLSPTTIVLNNLNRKRRGKAGEQRTRKFNSPLRFLNNGRACVDSSAYPSDLKFSKMLNNATEELKNYGCEPELYTDCYENELPLQKDTLMVDCLLDNSASGCYGSGTNLFIARKVVESTLIPSVKEAGKCPIKNNDIRQDAIINALMENSSLNCREEMLVDPWDIGPSYLTKNNSVNDGKFPTFTDAHFSNVNDIIHPSAEGNSSNSGKLPLKGDINSAKNSDVDFSFDYDLLHSEYPPGLWF